MARPPPFPYQVHVLKGKNYDFEATRQFLEQIRLVSLTQLKDAIASGLGNSSAPCQSCRGKGKTECRVCHGNGQVVTLNTCRTCNGTGKQL